MDRARIHEGVRRMRFEDVLVLLSRKIELPPNQRPLVNDGDSCRFQ